MSLKHLSVEIESLMLSYALPMNARIHCRHKSSQLCQAAVNLKWKKKQKTAINSKTQNQEVKVSR